MELHNLLKRQLRKIFGSQEMPNDPKLRLFVEAVNSAYSQADEDRRMLEHSFDLSSHELLQINSSMQAIFNASPDFFIRVDLDGKILDYNIFNESDLIHKDMNLVGKKITNIPYPEVSEGFKRAIEEVRDLKQLIVYEYKIDVKGSEAFFEARLAPLRSDQIIIIIRNITDRKITERELGQSKQQLEDIIDFLPDPTFVIDQDKKVIAWNHALEQMTGVLKSEVLGKGDYAYAVPFYGMKRSILIDLVGEEISYENLPYDYVANRNGILYSEIYLQSLYNGAGANILCTASPLRDKFGVQYGAIEIVSDISQIKKTEKSLKEQATLLDIAHDAILVASLTGEIKYWNNGAEQVYGWAKDEAIGKNINGLLSRNTSEFHTETAYLTTLEYGEWMGELTQFDNNDRERILASRWNLVRNIKGEPDTILIINTDITEKKKLEIQFFHAQKMDSIGSLAGGIAHDFNNLLTVISGNLALVNMYVEESASIAPFIAESEKAVERASTLTKQLLAFSRKQVIEPKIVNLDSIIAGIQKMLTRLIGENIDLQVEYAGNLGLVRVDPGQIEQVIVNLCVNARDAMSDGGTLKIKLFNSTLDEADCLKIHGSKPGEYVVLLVSDTGTGIEKVILDRIFEPFFTTKAKGEGTGLGLATVLGIIQQHDGFIAVETKQHIGTNFSIFLPRIYQPAIDIQDDSDQAEFRSGTETILLAEDDISIRKLLEAILPRWGYHLISKSNGEEALKVAHEFPEPIHLLITDVIMPKMNGKDLAKQMQIIRKDTKILFISGYTENIIGRHGVLESGTNFLRKPFSLYDLSEKIRNTIDQTETQSHK